MDGHDRRFGVSIRQDGGWNGSAGPRYGYSATQESRRNSYPPSQEDRRNGYPEPQDGRRNGVVAADGYNGSPYIEVPPAVEAPASSGWSLYSLLPSMPAILNRTSAKAQAESASSAKGSRAEYQRPSTYPGGQSSDFSGHSSYYKPASSAFESKDANGAFSQGIGDLPRISVGKDSRDTEFEDSLRDRIVTLESRIKGLEKDLKATLRRFHVENIRADNLDKVNRKFKGELDDLRQVRLHADVLERENRNHKRQLEALHRDKARADDLETANRQYKGELEGLRRDKARADDLEKANRQYKGELEGLRRDKARADDLEKENSRLKAELEELHRLADDLETDNGRYKGELQELHRLAADLERGSRDYQAQLETKKQEVGEFQSKLQGQANALAAAELAKDAELKKLQSVLQDVELENQELKNWKAEHEKKVTQDTSTTGQFRMKVADLTYAKGQLEKKELQLTAQVHEQTKRIEDLKQHNAVIAVRLGAFESQVHSLKERLRDEREKSAKASAELQQKTAEIEELQKTLQPTTADEVPGDDGEPRERALKAQCSALEEKAESREVEVEGLKKRLQEEWENAALLEEKLQQCDLQIDDLKNQILDLERRSDSPSVEIAAAPKEFIGGESFLEVEATPYLLDGAVQRVHEVAGIFARLLMKAMEQGKIDGMAVARNNFVRSISVGKAAPLKYVLEAITCKLLFQGFEHECFDLQDSTSGFLDMEQQRMDNFRQYKYLNSIDDPEQLVLTDDSLFTHFCRIKLERLSAAIPEIESMVQEIILRTFERSVSSDDSTDVATYLASKLGTTFVKLALFVWQVHKLAFAFNPVARIFRVSQSEKFVEKYMESVIFQESESEDEDMPRVDISRVDFMVVPGFLINRIVIRSRVFVVTKPLSGAIQSPQRSGDIQLAQK